MASNCASCGVVRENKSRTPLRPNCRACANRARLSGASGRMVSQCRTMTDVEAAWLGAMIEGEGSIANFPGRVTRAIQIRVYSTCIETLDRCQQFAGCGRVYAHKREKSLGNKPAWVWCISRSNSVLDCLRQVMPHLTSKRDRAEEVIQICQ